MLCTVLVALTLSNAALAAAQDSPPADQPADAKPTEAAKPADAEALGSLSVSSTPAGKVFLDGTDTGLTTPVVDLPVAPGKHTLRIVAADGRETTTEFTIEAGGALNLHLNLPEAQTEPKVETPAPPTAEVPVPEPEQPTAEAPWTWMTVAGWTGLGLGTIGLLAGAVVLTTPTDPDQGPLGFGLFGGGVGLVIGGGVLLYLDTELADASAASAQAAPSK